TREPPGRSVSFPFTMMSNLILPWCTSRSSNEVLQLAAPAARLRFYDYGRRARSERRQRKTKIRNAIGSDSADEDLRFECRADDLDGHNRLALWCRALRNLNAQSNVLAGRECRGSQHFHIKPALTRCALKIVRNHTIKV